MQHSFAMKYDYVIFGASGFTGQFVVEFMANALKRDNDESSTWAISGRNEGKLRLVGHWPIVGRDKSSHGNV